MRTAALLGLLLCALACSSGGGGDKEKTASAAEPSCEEAYAHVEELMRRDPDMAAQSGRATDEQRRRGRVAAVAKCRDERWSVAVRGCYREAKDRVDLGRCIDLQEAAEPSAR